MIMDLMTDLLIDWLIAVKGMACETSGGLLICLPREQAAAFCKVSFYMVVVVGWGGELWHQWPNLKNLSGGSNLSRSLNMVGTT